MDARILLVSMPGCLAAYMLKCLGCRSTFPTRYVTNKGSYVFATVPATSNLLEHTGLTAHQWVYTMGAQSEEEQLLQ